MFSVINPLNAELNLICHLLALLRAHHIFHVSRIRVNFVLKAHLRVHEKYTHYKYSDTSANEDNSFQNHIR